MPLDRGQRLAHHIVGIIVELLLIQPVRAEANLQHRHGRRVVLNNDRRLDAGWHQSADRIGPGIDLGNRQVYVDVGLEEYLLDSDALKQLALHVADVANVGAVRIFAIGGNALFHFLRRQPGILPNH
jgi:hypothetical protein